jgi:hypothetical protein
VASGSSPIRAQNDADTAIAAYSTSGEAIVALSQSSSAIYAQTGTSIAVYGFATSAGGIGVSGSGETGVRGSGDTGVHGSGDRGVYGIGEIGVHGYSSSSSSLAKGVYGESWAEQTAGVYGNSRYGYGVRGNTDDGYGVAGRANAAAGIGVYGIGFNGALAGYFSGNVQVTGNLSKGGGSFKIDHPLDPQNKYLYHSFVESPDMLNIYRGTVALDGKGEAIVTMPDWFEALNRDFDYQLTAIGAPAPDLHIAEEIAGNRFKIAGGMAGMKVSWQVTGTRQDPYANAHRIPVEEDKPADERGKYLHPTEWGQPDSLGVDYEDLQNLRSEEGTDNK